MRNILAEQSRSKNARLLSLLLALLVVAAVADAGSQERSNVERRLKAGLEHQASGRFAEARDAFKSVLERDPRNLRALAGLAEVAASSGDSDEEVYYLGRYLTRASKVKDLPVEVRKTQRAFEKTLGEKDPYFGKVDSYKRAHLRRLIQLGMEHLKKGRFHEAKMIFEEVIHLQPDSGEARTAFRRIETEGGNELAADRLFGEEDIYDGMTSEQIEKLNARHSTWDTAWKEKLDNYTVITDGGYTLLKVTALALEQLDGFFRTFYQYKTQGGDTPHIQVKIFKDRAEFMEIGRPHVEWAGGYYNGSEVVTYDPRGEQAADDPRSAQEPSRTLQGLIQTIAHEVSHHFVNIAPGSGVPPWLNEGLASFFEGIELKSNNRVVWNLVASHRLRPLVDYLKSPKPPNLANIIACKVDDYRIYYPYGWGVVYFLYNYENDEGKYVFRKALNDYRAMYVGGVDHLERFVKFLIERPKVEGIETFDDFEKVFNAFILRIYEEYMGRAEVGRQYEKRADELVESGDLEKAKLFYEKALKKIENDPEILWKLAGVLEELGEDDRAVGTLRDFLRNSEFHGIGADPRLQEAAKRIEELDPLANRFNKIRAQFEADLLSVARGYRDSGLYLKALETARELAVADNPSIAARDFYLDVEEESGKSLEQWQVVFNEVNLIGWHGEEITNQFTVEDEKLVGTVTDADVAAPRSVATTGNEKKEKTIPYKIFFIDKQVPGDFSLEAEVSAPEGCDLYGICFGARSKDKFQAILLKHDGNLDISNFDGGWFIRRHLPVHIAPEDWTGLRVDVRGNVLKVAINGELLEELEFENPADLRGEVGILVGRGRAEYRNIRYLERNWRLPYRRVKRRFTSDFVDVSSIERAQPGEVYYRGEFPPPLTVLMWHNREEVTLDDLVGKVVILAFWTTYQERVLPTLPLFEKIAETTADLDVELLIVSNDKPADFVNYAKEQGMPYPVAIDFRHKTINDYAIPDVGLPHIKLIDMTGKVVWEGNPEWSQTHGSYLDQPLEELIKKRRLAEIAVYRKEFPRAEQAIAAGGYGEAFEIYKPFMEMDPSHPDVRFAQKELERIRNAASCLLGLAEKREAAGNLLGAHHILDIVRSEFTACAESNDAGRLITLMEKEKGYKDCLWIEHRIGSAFEAIDDDEPDRFKKLLGRVRERLEGVVADDRAGVRALEYQLILDWLAGRSGQNGAEMARELRFLRQMRATVETIEEYAAGQRLTEARRLCAETMDIAAGTPFEDRTTYLLDNL